LSNSGKIKYHITQTKDWAIIQRSPYTKM
jgi:hypothetical protein